MAHPKNLITAPPPSLLEPPPRAGDVSVELIGATRCYGALRAADSVSLKIRHGEFFTILGSSGSGKTTTLRLIGGFELPDEGRVLINGENVSSFPAHRRDVHTVFQDYALFPHLTVFENVAFACRLKSVRSGELRERVMNALELVQLNAHAARKPTQLSGGQQQRVALARAIVDRPAVLLLDEPLSALDAKIRTEVREELKLLQRSTGITFVYVTHDQEEALTLSDRIAVMRGGRVVQVGAPIEIYEKPADLFVASFVGKANFIPGILRSVEGSRCQVETSDGIIEGFVITSELKPGSKVRVMIRPENLRLSPGSADSRHALIKQVSYLGHGTEYLLAAGDRLFRALELRRRGSIPLAEGTPVSYGWNWDEALVYAEEAAI